MATRPENSHVSERMDALLMPARPMREARHCLPAVVERARQAHFKVSNVLQCSPQERDAVLLLLVAASSRCEHHQMHLEATNIGLTDYKCISNCSTTVWRYLSSLATRHAHLSTSSVLPASRRCSSARIAFALEEPIASWRVVHLSLYIADFRRRLAKTRVQDTEPSESCNALISQPSTTGPCFRLQPLDVVHVLLAHHMHRLSQESRAKVRE